MVRLRRYEARTAKPVYPYLLRGEHRTLLIDSGMRATPAEILLPGLARDGLEPGQPSDGVITHADGAARVLIEDLSRLIRERYEVAGAWVRQVGGEARPAGHLLYWVEQDTAFVGDGLLGHGEDALHGTLHAPPSDLKVNYLQSVQRVHRLNPARLVFAHREALEGTAVQAFLGESEAWVREVDLNLRTSRRRPGGATRRELLREHAGSFGRYNVPGDLMYAFAAHLDALEAAGTLRSEPDQGVQRSRWAG